MEPQHRIRTRAVAARTLAPGALVLLVTLTACGGDEPAPSPTSAASAPSPPEPAAPGSTGPAPVAVTAGEVTLEVTSSAAADDPETREAPGAGTATVSLAPDATSEIALTSPGTFVVHPDGSVTVRDDAAAVGGLSAPSGARFVAVDDTRVELRAPEGEDAATESDHDEVTTTLGTRAVEHTDWGDREGGRSLAVSPTDWARTAGQAGVDVAWAEITSAEPEADTATVRDQLECHAIGARDKPTWNLEPWRPDVGLLATMAARCNPTS